MSVKLPSSSRKIIPTTRSYSYSDARSVGNTLQLEDNNETPPPEKKKSPKRRYSSRNPPSVVDDDLINDIFKEQRTLITSKSLKPQNFAQTAPRPMHSLIPKQVSLSAIKKERNISSRSSNRSSTSELPKKSNPIPRPPTPPHPTILFIDSLFTSSDEYISEQQLNTMLINLRIIQNNIDEDSQLNELIRTKCYVLSQYKFSVPKIKEIFDIALTDQQRSSLYNHLYSKLIRLYKKFALTHGISIDIGKINNPKTPQVRKRSHSLMIGGENKYQDTNDILIMNKNIPRKHAAKYKGNYDSQSESTASDFEDEYEYKVHPIQGAETGTIKNIDVVQVVDIKPNATNAISSQNSSSSMRKASIEPFSQEDFDKQAKQRIVEFLNEEVSDIDSALLEELTKDL